jgi:aminoglycoside 3-N-acetyltransferase
MYDLDGHVLLLGVGHDKSTTLHLAEDRTDHARRRLVPNGAPLLVDGTWRWVRFDEPFVFDEDFPAVAAAFAADTGLVRSGRVGRAEAALLPQRPLVDYAADWFGRHRD